MTARLLRLPTHDAAVSEVVGFILMFALSAIVLLISLQTFNSAQGNSNDLIAAVELKNLANRFSARIVQAGNIGSEFPLAEFRVELDLPETVAGYRYTITIRDRPPDNDGINTPGAEPIVYIVTEGDPIGPGTQGAVLTGEATMFKVREVKVNTYPIFLDAETIRSSAGTAVVRYWYETDPAQGTYPAAYEGHISIEEGTA